eukprot:scaffold7789_cov376-Prasinococcus_capsulatus_cf.AAC.4
MTPRVSSFQSNFREPEASMLCERAIEASELRRLSCALLETAILRHAHGGCCLDGSIGTGAGRDPGGLVAGRHCGSGVLLLGRGAEENVARDLLLLRRCIYLAPYLLRRRRAGRYIRERQVDPAHALVHIERVVKVPNGQLQLAEVKHGAGREGKGKELIQFRVAVVKMRSRAQRVIPQLQQNVRVADTVASLGERTLALPNAAWP